MPLKKGKSKRTIRANIRELMHSFKRTGKIGTSKPKNMLEARRQAVRIAFELARKS